MEVIPMTIFKRLSAFLGAMLLICMLLPVSAFAAGSIDPNRDVSLTISYRDGNTALRGASFSVYLVATVDEYGELTTTNNFANYNVKIRGKNDAAWRTLASTLEGYVLRDGLTPADKGTTDRQGSITFPSTGKKLTQGLYLVIGSRLTQNGRRYDPAPFMAMLPAQNVTSNTWEYDIAVNAKYDSSAIPTNPPVTPGTTRISRKVLKVWEDKGFEADRPKEIEVQLLRGGEVYSTVKLNAANNWRYTWTDLDSRYAWKVVEKELDGYTVTVTREGVTFVVTNTYGETIEDNETPLSGELPKTGQLWWPVPVLIAAGLLFIIIGLARRRGIRYEN